MDAQAILGRGEFRYRLVPDWARLPDGWDFNEVAAIDRDDQVYALIRGEHAVTVFDRDGNSLRSWGEGVSKRAHGLSIVPDDTVFRTDDGDHSVRRRTPDGRVLKTPGTPTPDMGGAPFRQRAHTALSPQGDIHVSDGYDNARALKFSPDGRLIQSWGESVPRRDTREAPRDVAETDPSGMIHADTQTSDCQSR